MHDLPTYVLEGMFDAPRDLVWKTWTDPHLVAAGTAPTWRRSFTDSTQNRTGSGSWK